MPRLKLAYSGVALNRAALSGCRAFPLYWRFVGKPFNHVVAPESPRSVPRR